MATENYNFVVPTGDTLVAPLTQEFENWNSVDNILKTISDSAVYSATELYSLTVHAITRSKADAALFRFTAVSKYTAGDTFTVDGVAVTALLPTGEALSDNAFVIGSEVLCCLKGTLLTVYTTNAIPETVENATKLNGQSANYYATAESVATINNNLGNKVSIEPVSTSTTVNLSASERKAIQLTWDKPNNSTILSITINNNNTNIDSSLRNYAGTTANIILKNNSSSSQNVTVQLIATYIIII